jgi:hypothetical protein
MLGVAVVLSVRHPKPNPPGTAPAVAAPAASALAEADVGETNAR